MRNCLESTNRERERETEEKKTRQHNNDVRSSLFRMMNVNHVLGNYEAARDFCSVQMPLTRKDMNQHGWSKVEDENGVESEYWNGYKIQRFKIQHEVRGFVQKSILREKYEMMISI